MREPTVLTAESQNFEAFQRGIGLKSLETSTVQVSTNDKDFSLLCEACRALDFTGLAWSNQPREYKAFPGVLPNAGCINTTRHNFFRKRPKLGTIAEIHSRADRCSLCSLVSKRLRELNLVPPGRCSIQAVLFCTDTTSMNPTLPEALGDSDSTVLLSTGSMHTKTCTTTRMAVIHEQAENDMDAWLASGWAPERTLLQFQACDTPVPTIADSIISSKRVPSYGGRLVNSLQVDAHLLQFWLKRCEESHGSKCAGASIATRHPITDILLIDAVDECIVKSSSSSCSRYACLSYVWGNANTCCLTRQNYDQLTTKGSLAKAPLPATIRDAITVTHQMGLRYLWVDAICIIQDDKAHQELQIAQMAGIYAHSLFTITAVSGDNANAGLPGLHPGTRVTTTQEVIKTPCGSLIPVIDFLDYYTTGHRRVSYSTWYSRAWTMQEQMFSRRKLIFAENQVFWHCALGKWVEETELEYGCPTGYSGYRFGQDFSSENPTNRGGTDSDSLNFQHSADYQLDIDLHPSDNSSKKRIHYWYRHYRELATRYMNRSLTYESDRLNAFTGILAGLSSVSGERFIWGLPQRIFCHALTWTIDKQPRSYASHTKISKNGAKSTFPLPSWSWVAWRSAGLYDLRFKDNRGVEDDPGNEVVFYQWDTAGAYRRIEEQDARQDSGVEVQQNDRLAHLWKELPATIDGADQDHFDEREDRGLLRFWTSVTTVDICSTEEGAAHVLPAHGSRNALVKPLAKGHGDISISTINTHVTQRKEGADEPSRTTCRTHHQNSIRADLVVIRRSPFMDWSNNMKKYEYLDALVVHSENNVAYRIGLAKVPEAVWVGLENRRWELVTLG
jgi:hypothetical protein